MIYLYIFLRIFVLGSRIRVFFVLRVELDSLFLFQEYHFGLIICLMSLA